MFPLLLLALIFVSTAATTTTTTKTKMKTTPDPVGMRKKQKEEEEEKEERGGLVLGRGDLLEVPRTLFTHFGIYLGRGRVAHFIPDILPLVTRDQNRIRHMVTNLRLILGVLAKRGSIRVDSLEDFAYGSPVLINTMDKVCSRPSLRGEEVARRAEQLQGHVTYSLLWYNCEHYVTFCRYGSLVSFQTFQFCKTVRKTVLSRRVAKATALLGACLLLYLGSVSTCDALVAVTLPFLIWMAS